jgi:hypothetical protein
MPQWSNSEEIQNNQGQAPPSIATINSEPSDGLVTAGCPAGKASGRLLACPPGAGQCKDVLVSCTVDCRLQNPGEETVPGCQGTLFGRNWAWRFHNVQSIASAYKKGAATKRGPLTLKTTKEVQIQYTVFGIVS